MKIIKEKNLHVPIKLWLNDIEDGALNQARNLAQLPFAFRHIALMPDAHQGFGMPIGGIFAAEGVIIPNAVGVDIGCGMCAVKTSLTELSTEQLKYLLGDIRRKIPVGFKHHKEKQVWSGFNKAPDIPVIQQELKSAHYQLGTLGGGNHFIEIQKGSDSHIWIMIHSGSRNFGLKIAKEYHRQAGDHCRKKNISLPDRDLAYFEAGSKNAGEYLAAMNFALDFARENRFHMINAVSSIFKEEIEDISFEPIINIHHNYAALETHYGQKVFVHRKGATSAQEGQQGIIPGSQGTKSYIVTGRGNPESFMSCSHGAGRVMGRKEAQRKLNLHDEQQKLDDQGILHSIRGVKDLDEASGAYKEINTVMKNQKDLVEIDVELSPLAVVKG